MNSLYLILVIYPDLKEKVWGPYISFKEAANVMMSCREILLSGQTPNHYTIQINEFIYKENDEWQTLLTKAEEVVSIR